MKTFYLFFCLSVLCLRNAIGQTDSSITSINSPQQKTRYFGIGIGLMQDNQPILTCSPTIQINPSKNIHLYLGPSFLISQNEIHFKNQTSFRTGISYLPWVRKNKIIPFIKFELNRVKYEFNSVMYDYAVPNIPIKATVLNEHRSVGLFLNSGVLYKIKSRFFVGADLGVWFLWERNIQHGTSEAYTYKKYGEKTPLEFNILYMFSIETEIYF
jgi:hypothetical protein